MSGFKLWQERHERAGVALLEYYGTEGLGVDRISTLPRKSVCKGTFNTSFLTSHLTICTSAFVVYSRPRLQYPHLHTEDMDILIEGTRLSYIFTTGLYVFSLPLAMYSLCTVDKEDTTPTTQPPTLLTYSLHSTAYSISSRLLWELRLSYHTS